MTSKGALIFPIFRRFWGKKKILYSHSCSKAERKSCSWLEKTHWSLPKENAETDAKVHYVILFSLSFLWNKEIYSFCFFLLLLKTILIPKIGCNRRPLTLLLYSKHLVSWTNPNRSAYMYLDKALSTHAHRKILIQRTEIAGRTPRLSLKQLDTSNSFRNPDINRILGFSCASVQVLLRYPELSRKTFLIGENRNQVQNAQFHPDKKMEPVTILWLYLLSIINSSSPSKIQISIKSGFTVGRRHLEIEVLTCK